MNHSYKLIEIPRFDDDRGSLSFVELGQILDFPIHRVYWLYNLKKDRGGHAHKNLKQFIFCTHGLVDFVLDDGEYKTTITLDAPNKGLYILKPLWREITNIKNNPQVIICASENYQESDYIRSYEEFKLWKSNF
ncbi:FdtA/QdtA family cupin domain-containing protein [Rickettsia endosymbiont of Lasioglossum villosulum]|uniref:sugar 3,4-ketoisomerase n=1 Tax=Rickettsia endosymbiont of Lasioglossum villosulum TaxID=3066269 RepID=UPI0031334AA8